MSDKTRVDQSFLDSEQYLKDSILRYESVYGEDFVSPGGRAMASELIARLGLEPGARVLDVGCGLGGSAFVMARDFDLTVDGIDLSKNMLALAAQKLDANGLTDQVALRWGDCLELDCEESYDAVYSRDVFLHIADKKRLFDVLLRALRRGGKLLFTDYCCAEKPWSDGFSSYVEARGYSLHTIDDYTGLIAAAGFVRVEGVDITTRFAEILQDEIARIESAAFGSDERDALRRSWRQKLERARQGEQRWGLFEASKP